MRVIAPLRKQEGAVLVVSLMMLLLLLVLAVAGMRGTLLEERMAGNVRDHNLALQAAEAALREGEINGPAGCNGDFSGTIDWCLPEDTELDDIDWDDAQETSSSLSATAAKPRYVVQRQTASNIKLSSSLKTTEQYETRTYYRIIARGVGGNSNTAVILQSTYLSND